MAEYKGRFYRGRFQIEKEGRWVNAPTQFDDPDTTPGYGFYLKLKLREKAQGILLITLEKGNGYDD